MQKYYIVCDYRESAVFNNQINDHYSLSSINNIIDTLKSLGYNCTYFGGVRELIGAIQNDNYDKTGVYLNFNDGLFTVSKRGQTPILLEMMKVKYSGSTPLTHLLVSDKFFTNQFLKNNVDGLLIPKCTLINKKEDLLSLDLNYPIILKPNDEGSSLGINEKSLCHSITECLKQYGKLKNFDQVIAQEFVNGYELTNYFIRNHHGILFNEILMISKKDDRTMDNDLFTYEDKSKHNRKYYNPIDILNSQQINTIKSITEKVANSLDILTLGRIDYRLYQEKLYFIEANTLPAFSITSEIGQICKIHGYTYTFILEELLKSLD